MLTSKINDIDREKTKDNEPKTLEKDNLMHCRVRLFHSTNDPPPNNVPLFNLETENKHIIE
jgi:hypothetical protein